MVVSVVTAAKLWWWSVTGGGRCGAAEPVPRQPTPRHAKRCRRTQGSAIKSDDDPVDSLQSGAQHHSVRGGTSSESVRNGTSVIRRKITIQRQQTATGNREYDI